MGNTYGTPLFFVEKFYPVVISLNGEPDVVCNTLRDEDVGIALTDNNITDMCCAQNILCDFDAASREIS